MHVRVPATSANLGPGFDCACGLALSLHDDVVARVADGGLQRRRRRRGRPVVPRDESHLVVRAMRAAFDPPGWSAAAASSCRCANRIPHGRGLGSSAAAIVAGVAARPRAGRSGGEPRCPTTAAFALAAELEGHPDNVAACLVGGLTIAWTDRGGPGGARG